MKVDLKMNARMRMKGNTLIVVLIVIAVGSVIMATYGKRALKTIGIAKMSVESESGRFHAQANFQKLEGSLSSWITERVNAFTAGTDLTNLPLKISYDSQNPNANTAPATLKASFATLAKDVHRIQWDMHCIENCNPDPKNYPKSFRIRLVLWKTADTFIELVAQSNVLKARLNDFSTLVLGSQQDKYYVGDTTQEKVGLFFERSDAEVVFVNPGAVKMKQIYTSLPDSSHVRYGGTFNSVNITPGPVTIDRGIVLATSSPIQDLVEKIDEVRQDENTWKPAAGKQVDSKGMILLCRGANGTTTSVKYVTKVYQEGSGLYSPATSIDETAGNNPMSAE